MADDSPATLVADLSERARHIRVKLIKMIMHSGSGHAGGGLSIADLLACLYFKELRIKPDNPKWTDRDRLVLSKGHGAFALYSTLAEAGFFPENELYTAYRCTSMMQAHPELGVTPGVEMSTGALGQGLSAAQGMALAAKLTGAPTRVYAIVGDGELHEGQCWEALMSIPKFKLDNICVVVDFNSLCLSGNVSDVMPIQPFYSKAVAFGWHVVEINGHSITQILNGFNQARATKDQPTLIIARTVKGRGVPDYEDKWNCHVVMLPDLDKGAEYLKILGCDQQEIDAFKKDEELRCQKSDAPKEENFDEVIAALPGKRSGKAAAPRDVIGDALVEAGKKDPKVVVLDADFHPASKITPFLTTYPERFYAMGIAEQNMMTTAAGLAASGMVPFASCICTFASRRPCDQITVSIALPKLNVKILGVYPGLFVGTNGASHQSLEDIAIMRALPAFSVIHPADALETRQVIQWCAENEGPVYLRIARDACPQILPDDYQFQLGKAYTLREGNDVTVMVYGELIPDVLSAAMKLEKEGIKARVLNMSSIKPVDTDAILKAASETGKIVTVDNHNVVGGLGDAVAEVLCDNNPVRLKRLGVVNSMGKSGKNADMKQYFGLDSSSIARDILSLVKEIPK